MTEYEHIEIRVFGSRRETASYDTQDEEQIARAIREEVLPAADKEYRAVRVKVKRKENAKPDHLVAYLLRKDTYTADVVRVDVDENFEVRKLTADYDDSGEEEDEEEEGAGAYAPEEYAVDFVAATPETGIPSAVKAVEDLHKFATDAGLNSKKLLGSSANRSNYQSYLKSGVKGFVNIGHGFTGGIILADGTLSATWFDSLSANPVAPAVVYFNSCQVFNPPLQPAVMKSGARSYIGGIVNLGIGTSEEVCKCFWNRAFSQLHGMRNLLTQCEREKYPTQGAHGFSGDVGLFWEAKWYHNLSVLRTHAKHGSKMAWALFGGSDWIQVRPNSPDGTTNLFTILCEALGNDHKVDLYIHNSQIEQLTLR